MAGIGTWLGGIAGLAVAAAIVIPNLLHPTCRGGNETAAIATLRNLARCEQEFRALHRVDVDRDGIGEFGTFGEMTGVAGVRLDATSGKRGPRIAPAVLSPALSNVDSNGMITRSGYAFRIYLPGVGGGAVHEGPAPRPTGELPSPDIEPAQPFSGPVDTDSTEQRWCAYAWPVAFATSGRQAFFVDQDGEVWWCTNDDGRYSGTTPTPGSRIVPVWDAAMPTNSGKGWVSLPPKVDRHVGRDGDEWRRYD